MLQHQKKCTRLWLTCWVVTLDANLGCCLQTFSSLTGPHLSSLNVSVCFYGALSSTLYCFISFNHWVGAKRPCLFFIFCFWEVQAEKSQFHFAQDLGSHFNCVNLDTSNQLWSFPVLGCHWCCFHVVVDNCISLVPPCLEFYWNIIKSRCCLFSNDALISRKKTWVAAW